MKTFGSVSVGGIGLAEARLVTLRGDVVIWSLFGCSSMFLSTLSIFLILLIPLPITAIQTFRSHSEFLGRKANSSKPEFK
jgi:hypothetical protein